MTAFVFIIVLWLNAGGVTSDSGVFSTMQACEESGKDIATAANANPDVDHVRWRCEEVDGASKPPADDEPDAPALPPGHPPIGRRGI